MEAIMAAEDVCNKKFSSSDKNYYEDYYNCLKTNHNVVLVEGCASCYCKEILHGNDQMCGTSPNTFLGKL